MAFINIFKKSSQDNTYKISEELSTLASLGTNRIKELLINYGNDTPIELEAEIYLEFICFELHIFDKISSNY